MQYSLRSISSRRTCLPVFGSFRSATQNLTLSHTYTPKLEEIYEMKNHQSTQQMPMCVTDIRSDHFRATCKSRSCTFHIFNVRRMRTSQTNQFIVVNIGRRCRSQYQSKSTHSAIQHSLTHMYSSYENNAEANSGEGEKKLCSITHRFIDETLGTLSCEQIPSASNRSRISQANIVGFSRL